MKTMLTALALTALIAVPAMADEGVMPQASKIIVNNTDTTQQGIGVGKGAHSGKMHTMKKHHGKKHAGKKHHGKHHGAAKKAAK